MKGYELDMYARQFLQQLAASGLSIAATDDSNQNAPFDAASVLAKIEAADDATRRLYLQAVAVFTGRAYPDTRSTLEIGLANIYRSALLAMERRAQYAAEDAQNGGKP